MTTDLANIEREEMDCDVLIVGGGSAGLSAAYHLQNMINQHNEAISSGAKQGEALEEPMIVVLEKGSEIGAHSLSGAVMNPAAIREMMPDYKDRGFPIECDATYDAVYYLGKEMAVKAPITPPPFHNIGNHIVSISKVNHWLGEQAEALGVNIFPGFPAVECLYGDNGEVIGVRTGDRGLDKDGKPKDNFEPGMIIKSKVTIFADGTNSPLFKRVEQKLDLRKGKHPKSFELGCKEIIQMPAGTVEPGQVIHTAGYPLNKSIGGSWIYTMPNDQISIGIVAYLDTEDPLLDVHRELQKWKAHPFMQKMLKGGKVIAYGGKTLPAGGWYSMPKLYHAGMLVAGDAAAMVDVKKLKGIHLAMKGGMLAAETALEAMIANDFSEKQLSSFDDKINHSFVKTELWKVRNFHQALSKGLFASMPEIAIQELTNGWSFGERVPLKHRDYETTEPTLDVWGPNALEHEDNQLPQPDNEIFFDKLSSVYMTATGHDEDSPNHLLLQDGNICSDQCAPKYNSPCNHFCPANVYEMIPKEGVKGRFQLQINYTNCIHCQTCDLKCPFNNIDWTLPEGAGGPNYTEV